MNKFALVGILAWVLMAGIASGGTSYVQANGQTIAKINDSGVFYYHPDHLGSTSALTDREGNVVEEQVNLPFGELLTGEEKYGFTGKELDETNLQYFGARYYNPNSGRFLNSDPARDGMSWYSYVANNPLRYIDPTGNRLEEARILDDGLKGVSRKEVNKQVSSFITVMGKISEDVLGTQVLTNEVPIKMLFAKFGKGEHRYTVLRDGSSYVIYGDLLALTGSVKIPIPKINGDGTVSYEGFIEMDGLAFVLAICFQEISHTMKIAGGNFPMTKKALDLTTKAIMEDEYAFGMSDEDWVIHMTELEKIEPQGHDAGIKALEVASSKGLINLGNRKSEIIDVFKSYKTIAVTNIHRRKIKDTGVGKGIGVPMAIREYMKSKKGGRVLPNIDQLVKKILK